MQDRFEYKLPVKFQIIIRQSILCLKKQRLRLKTLKQATYRAFIVDLFTGGPLSVVF